LSVHQSTLSSFYLHSLIGSITFLFRFHVSIIFFKYFVKFVLEMFIFLFFTSHFWAAEFLFQVSPTSNQFYISVNIRLGLNLYLIFQLIIYYFCKILLIINFLVAFFYFFLWLFRSDFVEPSNCLSFFDWFYFTLNSFLAIQYFVSLLLFHSHTGYIVSQVKLPEVKGYLSILSPDLNSNSNY